MKPVKKLKDLLFTCQYENKTLKQILFENQLERWVPGCTYSYTEKEHLARYRWVAKFVRNKSIVDIACGAGKGSYILASLGKAKKVIAGDIDQDTLKYASLKYFHPKIKYINIEAEGLSLKSKSADVIISFETIEHLKRPAEFLKRASRVLKPGGKLIVSTPISPKKINKEPYDRYHIREWGYQKFLELITKYFIVKAIFTQKGSVISKTSEGKITAGYLILIAENYQT